MHSIDAFSFISTPYISNLGNNVPKASKFKPTLGPNSKQLEIFELKNCGGGDMGFNSIINTIHLNDNNKIKVIHFEKNAISNVSYEILKKLNEIFKAKDVVFYLDKTEEEINIDCVRFNK